MESASTGDFVMMAEPIEDKTGAGAGKLPQDLTMLVESALQNVGPPLVVMPHGDRSFQLANQKGREVFSVHGAITEFDAATISKGTGKNIGLFYKDVDLGFENSQDFSKGTIAMDFMLLNPVENIYIPGVKATAKGTIEKHSKNKGFSFSIVGNGFGMDGHTNSQTPIHHMINIMVEYCMVQLIGQSQQIPYWLFIQGSDPDYRQIRKLKRKFHRYSQATKNYLTSYFLHLMDPSISINREIDNYTKQKIILYKKRFNIIPVNDSLTSEFYVKLLTDGVKMARQNQLTNHADNMIDNILK